MAKRELIDTGTDKRYVRPNKLDKSIVESDDVYSRNHRPAKVRPVDRLATKAGNQHYPEAIRCILHLAEARESST
jgi:hypothetical protein